MIAALLQIIDNTKRENHTICLNINGVIFFRRPSVVCLSPSLSLFFFLKSEHDEKVKRISEGNRGTCCQGKRSLLKKCICLMKNFRLHCFSKEEGENGEKTAVSTHKRLCVVCIIFARFPCSLCCAENCMRVLRPRTMSCNYKMPR